MFKVDNAVPFRNGILIQGKFTEPSPKLVPGDMLQAEKPDGSRVGMVRFVGILSAGFTHDPASPRYHISVAFDGDYRNLVDCTLKKI